MKTAGEEKAMTKTTRKTALTIAGSDPGGGAGIQADIKTMMAHGVYAMSAVTALTAQNTTGVYGILDVPVEFLEQQLDRIFTDIVPDAVKIGMLSSGGAMKAIAGRLRAYEARHVVLDPVMVSTSGRRLMREEAVLVMQEELFPLAEVITPNIPEAEVLTGRKILGEAEMEQASAELSKRHCCAVLLKGGHRTGGADDLLYQNGTFEWIRGDRIDNPNTHGTGCTLSSAIASNLALGFGLFEAVRRAKAYLTRALEAQLDLGKGIGPVDHAWGMKRF